MDTLVAPTQLSAADKMRLAKQYAGLVRTLARRIAQKLPDHVELDDLIQDGNVGLLDALNRFDPSKGIQFQTYATNRVRGAILDSLRSGDWVSRGARRRARELSQEEEKLTHQLGRQPRLHELAQSTSLTQAEVWRRKHESSKLAVVSLQQPAPQQEEENCWGDTLVDDSPTVEERAMSTCRQQMLLEGLHTLSERERTILALYYFEELCIREIGTIFGVSEARISQIHSRSLRKLREVFQAQDQICRKVS